MNSLIDEIKDDIQRERFETLWKRYALYIISAMLLIILATAANVWWRNHQTQRIHHSSTQFYQAENALKSGKSSEAQALWQDIMTDGPRGYSALASLRLASLWNQQNQHQAASELYTSLQSNRQADKSLQQLALLYQFYGRLTQDGPSDVLRNDIAQNLQPGNTWYYLLLELQALHHLAENKPSDALHSLTLLTNDLETPTNIRTRAEKLSHALEQ